ncbi:MAG: 3-hydroxyacyl-CoA dehydrogenase NAD-binding domain-containing protein [Candidatus Bathyarchaeota archaeon]|nr:3-hydroxyacyl-CoA dehydrogenase NAD-binding domain-containing protein [Candidatus Bathyarchaeota archaeon]
MKPEGVGRITVLGVGVMGHGIAQIAAQAGISVTIRDIEQSFLDGAKTGIEKNLARLVERGRLKQEDVPAIMGRIGTTLSLPDAVRDADLVVEAVPERMEVKHAVWGEVSKHARADAILATNTSSLSITKMAVAVSDPGRFVGMHFFNPPTIMKLVEIIPGEKTRPETIALVKGLAERLGKTPVVVGRDAPGFIVNRVLITYLNEAAKLLQQGYTKEQVDATMQYKAGMPMGPFMLADLIGLDITYNILRVFEDNLGAAYRAAEPIQQLFAQRKLGKKTGEGFYVYGKPEVKEEQAKGFDPALLLKPFVAEAERLVAEGIADPLSVDLAVKLGANMPIGPFELKARLEAGVGLEEKPVLAEAKNGVLKITINRASKLNSITTEMLTTIADAVEKSGSDKSVRCIVITGAGDRAFSAGADIDEFSKLTPAQALDYTRAGKRAMKRIKASKKPVVAAINGFALGGGCELASWCDFRVAIDKAKLGQPEANLGVIPGWGGTKIVAKLVGKQRAKLLIATGENVTAEEARQIGLVDRVYPAAEYGAKVDEFVAKLAAASPTVVAAVKALTNPNVKDDDLEEESREFSKLFETRDFREGVSAFKEKRKPVFTGE